MFEFTETIRIQAPPGRVWEVLRDIEGWWQASNPEHDSLERLDDRDVEVGARFRIKERIAGIPGDAVGVITRLEPESVVTWEAKQARYRTLGMHVTLGEGVTWHLEPDGGGTRLDAHVWATSPPGVVGRVIGWAFVQPMHGVQRDREHARTELRYLKQRSRPPPNSSRRRDGCR